MRRAVMVVALAGVLGFQAHATAGPAYVWSIDGSVDNSGLPAGFGPGVPLGPNVSTAKAGAKIEIVGSGKFSPTSGWIDGGGSYRIHDPSGRLIAEGRWKPVGKAAYTDLGTEPEGSPVETLRAGVIVVAIALEGAGTGRLGFLCGVHRDGEELEGVKVNAAGWRFHEIEAGSTTIQRP